MSGIMSLMILYEIEVNSKTYTEVRIRPLKGEKK